MLGELFPGAADDFVAMADEAGVSRAYGGIHSPSDISEGKEHGERVGAAVLGFTRGDGAQ